MSLVIPAGLQPEGCAGAEYQVKISANCRQRVKAEKAAGGLTAPLPMSSQQGGALPQEGLGMRQDLSPCRGMGSCGCPGEARNECCEQGSPAAWAWLMFLQENQAGSHVPCLVEFGGLQGPERSKGGISTGVCKMEMGQ